MGVGTHVILMLSKGTPEKKKKTSKSFMITSTDIRKTGKQSRRSKIKPTV